MNNLRPCYVRLYVVFFVDKSISLIFQNITHLDATKKIHVTRAAVISLLRAYYFI